MQRVRKSVLCFALLIGAANVWADARAYTRLVILADTHLPTKAAKIDPELIQAKEGVLADINAWEDADHVVVVGDITGKTGTPEEYAYAKRFFGQLKKPL